MTREDPPQLPPALDAAPPHQEPPAQRPFDELPPRPWRGPLTFGIVAATLQMGALIWLARCR